MGERRHLPMGRENLKTIDPIRAGMTATRGLLKRMYVAVDRMMYTGEINADRVRWIAASAAELQSMASSLADEIEEAGNE